jgi:hypothetical protein
MALALVAALVVLASIASATEGTGNQVDDWCDAGIKHDNLSGPSFTVPEPPAGTTWTLLVIKSGTENETWVNPTPGQTYTPANGKDVSHAILCYREDTSTTTTTETPSSTTTEAPTTTTTAAESTTTTSTPESSSSTTSTTGPPTTVPIPVGVDSGLGAPPVGGIATGLGACADGACDEPWWNGNPIGVIAALLAATLIAIGAGTYYLTR